jgi:hypothetical protein
MIKNAAEPIVLELEPAVIAVEGSLFVAGNTARRDIDISDRRSLTSAAAFSSLFGEGATSSVRDWQSEIWVPAYISAQAITAVAARSVETHARLQAAWPALFTSWTYPPTLLETEAWNRLATISLDDLEVTL